MLRILPQIFKLTMEKMIYIEIGKVVFGILASVLGIFLGLSFAPGLREKFRFLKWSDGAGRLGFFILFVVCTILHFVLGAVQLPVDEECPIALSPEHIDFGSGAAKAIVPFFVRNAGERDLYQIVVKLMLESAALSVTNEDVSVEWVDVPKNIEMPVPVSGDPTLQVLLSYSGMVFPALDSQGREGLRIVINHLGPRESEGFRIMNQSSVPLPVGTHRLIASVVSCTNAPMSTTLDDDGALSIVSPTAGEMDVSVMLRGKVQLRSSGRLSGQPTPLRDVLKAAPEE